MKLEELQTMIEGIVGKAVGEAAAAAARVVVLEELKKREDAGGLPVDTHLIARILAGDHAADKAKNPDERPGIIVARMTRALALSNGRKDEALTILRADYGEDDDSVKAILASSAHAKAMLASDSQTGGVFVVPEFASSLIDLLRPGSVVRSLNPQVIPMNSGTITWPKVTGGPTSSYAGEVQNIISSSLNTGPLTLTAKKLTSLVALSNDLIKFSDQNTDAIIRDQMAKSMNERADLAFIRGNGAQGIPRGLRFWAPAAHVFTATASSALSPTIQEITTDLGRMQLRLREANVAFTRPGWIMAPRIQRVLMDARSVNSVHIWKEEMSRGMLEGYPYKVTTQVPINLSPNLSSELYLADFSHALIGESSGMTIDASNQAAYFDGATIRAAFSEDTTVIRAIQHHDFGMEHDAAVAILTAVEWANAPTA